jgi:dienelactone hydrolase
MSRTLLALLIVPAVAGCPGSGGLGGDPPAPTTPEDVTLSTTDGLDLAATWQASPGADRGPALLLLHQLERDRGDFDGIWDELVGAGYSVLAMDFRGHGASDPSDVPINQLPSDRDRLGWDVRAGIEFLRDQPYEVAPERVGAVGLSVGGNMAIVANHETHGALGTPWGVYAIATVSARLDRAEDLAGDSSLTLRDGLYVAAEDEDPQSAEAEALESITGGSREAFLVPGSSHGAALLAEDPDVQARIVSWFAEAGL